MLFNLVYRYEVFTFVRSQTEGKRMTLKRIPASFLCEALDAASQFAHAKNAEHIELQHVVYGAFGKLREYQRRILMQQERSPQLESIFSVICDTLEVPNDLPEKKGATNSIAVQQLLKDARLRAVKSARNFVLLEDVIVELLRSRTVIKLFANRSQEKQFLETVREQCLSPTVRQGARKRRFRSLPQYKKQR